MNSESNQKFVDRYFCKNESQILLRLNNDKNNYDIFCIVEGPSDQHFYKNISKYKDRLSKADYIWTTNVNDENSIGKEAVIRSYFDVRKEPELVNLLTKTLFIIDHDYYGLHSEKYDDLTMESVKKNFTMTNVYSFENYFLLQNNIEIIFKTIGLSSDDCKRFINKLKTFIDEIREFNSLKSTTVYVCKVDSVKVNIGRTKLYRFEDIFAYNFMENPFYNRNLLIKQTGYMHSVVSSNPISFKVYLGEKKKYYSGINYGISFTRGHDVYNFLISYLKQIHSVELDYRSNYELYKKVVSSLDVDIEFKFGNEDILKLTQ